MDYFSNKKQDITDETFKSFGNLSVNELVANYYIIENELIDKIKEILKSFFKFKEFQTLENIIQNSEHIYFFSVELLKIDRTVFIKIEDAVDEKINEKHIELDIKNQIGIIRSVLFSYPDKMVIGIKQILELIKHQILSVYKSIEQVYLTNSIELNEKFFDRLHNKFNHHLILNNKESLCDKYWFVIGHKNAFHYFFDKDKTKKLINLLKSNQISQYGPFELIVSLIKTPLNFQESLAAESWRQKRVISKEWGELKYKDEKLIYFLCERILYPSDGHTLWSICESRDYVLGIAMSNHDKKDVTNELKKIKEELEIIFKKGIKEYSMFFKTIRKFQSTISNNELHIQLARMSGAFTSEFFK